MTGSPSGAAPERGSSYSGAAPPLLRESEKGFQGWVVDRAHLDGWEVYHTHDSRHSAAGFPDLVLVRPPRVIFAEVKTDTGRLSNAQQRWLAWLDGCPGVETGVWRPADRMDITRMLAR